MKKKSFFESNIPAKEWIRGRRITSVNNFRGRSKDGNLTVSLVQDKNGWYTGTIVDEYGDVESATTASTQHEIILWFQDHGIKEIIWEK